MRQIECRISSQWARRPVAELMEVVTDNEARIVLFAPSFFFAGFLTMWLAQIAGYRFEESHVRYAIALVAAGALQWIVHRQYRDSVPGFLERLYAYRVVTWCGLAALSLAFTNVFANTQPRRLAFCLTTFPVLVLFLPRFFAWFKAADYHVRVTVVMLFILCFAVVMPGLHAPPFYGGIAGWTWVIDEDTPRTLPGIKLIRDDGEEIWFSHGIISPISFMQRQYIRASADDETFGDLMSFYFALYQRNYDLLRQGRFPNQRYLGRLAYPGHIPYRSMDYSAFPPERIARLGMVTESYDPQTGTNKVIGRYQYWDTRTGKVGRP